MKNGNNPRLDANRAILEKLSILIEKHPEWRFHQILQNAGISSPHGEDQWYEESTDTLKRMVIV